MRSEDERKVGHLLAKPTLYLIWIADCSNSHKAVEKPSMPPGVTPTPWQFSLEARLTAGYGGGMDANIFYGTEADCAKQFALALDVALSFPARSCLKQHGTGPRRGSVLRYAAGAADRAQSVE